MGGINPNPQSDDDDRPKTAREAEAIAGARVGFRGSYGGESGQAAQDYAVMQQQEEEQAQRQAQQERIDQRQSQQQQQIQDEGVREDFASRAFAQAQNRPGFTRESNLGDSETARRVANGEDVGQVLESQRQSALLTPGTKDEMYYAGELSKWAQNRIETSSSFHHLTKDAGVSVRENPYEIASDASVEFLKGGPHKRSEFFSPISGQMSKHLPEGRGLQETMWDAARTGKTPPGSYEQAINVINSSKGGFATGKIGSGNRTPTKTRVESFNGRELPAPFKSTVLNVRETTSKQSGELPLVGFVPFVSPFLSNFMPQINKREVDLPVNVAIKDFESGKPAYTRSFIDDSGKKSDSWTHPVGGPTFGEKKAVGSPKVTTRYNAITGETETTTEQTFEQEITQQYETVTLPKTGKGIMTMTTFSEGKTPFTEAVQSRMPERKPSTEKTFYLLGDKLGPQVAGPLKFASALIPTTTEWSKQSYQNIREDPLFAAPMVGVSVAIPTIGTIGRATGIGTKIAARPAYQFGSQVASGALVGLFADYSAKQITGTSILDIASNEYRYAVTGRKSESTASLMQRNFIGWDSAATRANRLSLEVLAGYGAYSAASFAGKRISQIARTRSDARLTNQGDFALPSNEGFPVNKGITTRDLVESYNQGRMATTNPSKLMQTEWSVSGRRLSPTEYPKNPQVMAKTGTTDVFSGADYPYLNQGYVGAGHSEIPGMYTAPSAVTYFTKPGTGGSGFGITNDLFGFAQNPTMYVAGIGAGKSKVIPRSVLNTPTRGYSANDPMNPRNLAVRDWMGGNLGYDEVAIGQYGKSEFQFLIKPGGGVTTKRLGYYMDNGMRIPVERVSLTGKAHPDYVEPPRPERPYNMFGGLPSQSRYSMTSVSIPYGASPFLRGTSTPGSSRSRISISSSPLSLSGSPSRSSISSMSKSSISSKSGSSLTGSSRSGLVSTGFPSFLTLTTTRSPKSTITTASKTSSSFGSSSISRSSRSALTGTSRTSITETTKTPTPFILPPGAPGSSGDKPFMNRGERKWSNTNPVATIPYLSRDPFSGKGKKKKKGGRNFPF